MRHLRITVLGLVCLAAAAALHAQELATYRMDPAHSSVEFVVRHMTISKVRGGFQKYTGNFQVNEVDFTRSQFEVRLEAASVNTENERRDADLRSERFFNVEAYPEIAFTSKRIEKAGEGYLATGDLTIHGVTREVPLAFTLVGPIKDPRGATRLGVEAHTTINRQDYGLTWNPVIEGVGLVVSDEVKIEINAELVKVNPEAAPPPPPK